MKLRLLALVLLLPGAASAAELTQRLPQEICLSARSAASPDAQLLEFTRCLATEQLTGHQRAMAYVARATLYAKKQDYQNALADLTSAIGADPTLAVAYADRGSLYLTLKDPNSAIADFSQALKLDPTITEVYILRGRAYDDLGRFDEAIADYTSVVNSEPRFKLVALQLRALAYADKRDWSATIADCTAALKLKDITSLYTLRAAAYENTGQYDKAAADFTTVVTRTPTDPLAYNNRATAYAGLKKQELVIADLSKAIELSPNQPLFYENRGFAYDETADCKSAIDDFDKALAINPDGIAYAGKAWVRSTCPDGAYRNGAEALDLAIKAIQLGPGNAQLAAAAAPNFHMALAAAYAEGGQFNNAVVEQELAIKLLPSDATDEMKQRANLALQAFKANKPFRWPAGTLVSSRGLEAPTAGFAAANQASALAALRNGPLAFPLQIQLPPLPPPQQLLLLPKELAP
ncbi:MAG TPA: tetratricopeptide repeat protein [Alphaproteobacteria bacterium]|nr:tetratricopeptide repeat protein [Alphaproteobacteria bacterium]